MFVCFYVLSVFVCYSCLLPVLRLWAMLPELKLMMMTMMMMMMMVTASIHAMSSEWWRRSGPPTRTPSCAWCVDCGSAGSYLDDTTAERAARWDLAVFVVTFPHAGDEWFTRCLTVCLCVLFMFHIKSTDRILVNILRESHRWVLEVIRIWIRI